MWSGFLLNSTELGHVIRETTGGEQSWIPLEEK
jgi:hypothetical protein